jgi:hypothetical protein
MDGLDEHPFLRLAVLSMFILRLATCLDRITTIMNMIM